MIIKWYDCSCTASAMLLALCTQRHTHLAPVIVNAPAGDFPTTAAPMPDSQEPIRECTMQRDDALAWLQIIHIRCEHLVNMINLENARNYSSVRPDGDHEAWTGYKKTGHPTERSNILVRTGSAVAEKSVRRRQVIFIPLLGRGSGGIILAQQEQCRAHQRTARKQFGARLLP